jgi:peptidoglycan hydrolase-like protein with peptidoglycan-binding domain
MKRLFLLLTVLSLCPLARADDQTQTVQQALKDKGFYFGTVDGEPGPETTAAIRRYQIRQGLEVTGQLDAQTLSSLNLGGNSQGNNTLQAVPPPTDQSANAPAPQAQTPPPDVVQSDHDILRNQPPAAAAPAPDDQDAPQPGRVAPQPFEQPQPPDQSPQPAQPPARPYVAQSLPQYAQFFRKTPYETAPGVVQRSTVQGAQARLARQGFYRGIIDGELSDGLSRALAAYQQDASLRVTGRLDMGTLADLNLLPRRQALVPQPMPYGPYGYGAPGPVYRGIWVH